MWVEAVPVRDDKVVRERLEDAHGLLARVVRAQLVHLEVPLPAPRILNLVRCGYAMAQVDVRRQPIMLCLIHVVLLRVFVRGEEEAPGVVVHGTRHFVCAQPVHLRGKM